MANPFTHLNTIEEVERAYNQYVQAGQGRAQYWNSRDRKIEIHNREGM